MIFEEWLTILKKKELTKTLKQLNCPSLLCKKMNLAFAVVSWWNKNERTKLTNELVSIDRQSNVCRRTKCVLQSFSELQGMPAHFRLISTPIFYQFTNYYCFLLWKYLKVTSYDEVTFFAPVWLHDNFNFIFRIMTQKHCLDWKLDLLCCIIHPLTIFGWGGSSSNSINMTGPMALNARKSTTSSSSSSSSSSPLASKPVALSSPTWSAEPGFSSPPSVKNQSTGATELSQLY